MLRTILFTQGGLGLPIALGLLTMPCAELCGVLLEEPPPIRRTLRERVVRAIRYHGVVGAAARLAQRMSDAPGPGGEPGAEELAELAREKGVPLLRASDVHAPEVLAWVRERQPDLGVVIGTTILRPSLFEIPRLGSINLHQARVPEYRGSGALFWALYNGEREMGITVHRVAERLDAGDVILETTVPLHYDFERFRGDYDPFAEHFRELIRGPSVDLVLEAVRRIAEGTATPRPQDAAAAVRRRHPTFQQKQELKRRLRSRFERDASLSQPRAPADSKSPPV